MVMMMVMMSPVMYSYCVIGETALGKQIPKKKCTKTFTEKIEEAEPGFTHNVAHAQQKPLKHN